MKRARRHLLLWYWGDFGKIPKDRGRFPGDPTLWLESWNFQSHLTDLWGGERGWRLSPWCNQLPLCTKASIKPQNHWVQRASESIQEEDITILNIYTPNIGSSQYKRQLLTTLKGQIDNNMIIVGEFNTPLTAMDRSSRQKINKETQALNDTLDKRD